MAMEIVVQDNFKWVLAAVFANVAINSWMARMVGAARTTYKVPYPTMYADVKENAQAMEFNCLQRAHQNTTEFLPTVLTMLVLGGLQYPLAAATFGACYFLARVQYWRGYSSGVAANRFAFGGRFIFQAYYGMAICATAFILHQFFPLLV